MKEPSGSGRTYDVDELLTLTDDVRGSRVMGSVSFLRTDKGVWVSASLRSELLCTCSRCLDEHRQPISMAIEEEFFPLVEAAMVGRPSRPGGGDDAFNIDRNHILDLTDAVKQYALLSMPMKPVCRADCLGICIRCGANLNEGGCVCDKTPRDSRWGALLELVTVDDQENRRGS